MIFGYGRQSRKRRETISESPDNQAGQLTKYGYTKIFRIKNQEGRIGMSSPLYTSLKEQVLVAAYIQCDDMR